MTLTEMFTTVIDNYHDMTKMKFKSNDFTDIVTKLIPSKINSNLNHTNKYLIKGSVGKGNWAETPWVAVLNTKVTETTRHGYYACYLIDPTKKTMYLSLSAGWTQFEENYPLGIAKKRIVEYCGYLSGQLPGKSPTFKSGPISLSASKSLSTGYELGQILSKQYLLDDMDDELLMADLKEALRAYEELIGLAGSEIQNISYEKVLLNEKIEQEDKDINIVSLEENALKAIASLRELLSTKPPAKKPVFLKKAIRNLKIARLIKESKAYICEICGTVPFNQKNGKPYAEADHIIPLGGKTNGLDSPDNMRCLCAQCHAIITHGSDEELRKLLA